MRSIFTFLIAILILSSCETKKEQADLIVTNATVYTVDDAFGTAESFAIKDGKFLAVGTSAEITAKYESLETIDATGKTVLPGLIDGHCHFYGLGQNLQIADLVGTTSYDDVVARVAAFAKANPKATVLRGRGWDQNDWEVKEFPTKLSLIHI